MKYTEVKFYCSGGESWHKDVLIDDLSQIGFDTFEDIEEGFCGYIPSEQFDEAQIQWLISQLPVDFSVRFEVREIQPENWNYVWESNFSPIQIGEDCYVRATFHEPKPQFPYEIIVDPKMSFGTGHHQTTSMMLEYILESPPSVGSHVLDMGCGTGILAILALKMGATSATAIDYDPVCIDSVVENAELNGVSEHIIPILGSSDLLVNKKFDIVYANINRNILLEQFVDYYATMNSGAKIYISGFYYDRDLEILKEHALGFDFQFMGCKIKDDWAAACFQKT